MFEKQKQMKELMASEVKEKRNLEILNKIENRRKRLFENDMKTEEQLKRVMKEEPKFVKLERKYHEEFKTPALEERKKTLEMRRNL